MDNLSTFSNGSAVADFINKNGFGEDYLPMFYRDEAGMMIVNQSLGDNGQGGGGGMTMGDLIDAWVANNGSSDAFYFMFAGPKALSDDQYKATQKAYNNFVKEAKYMDAVNLVITAFNLDEIVKGHYTIDVVNKPSENGDYEPWMTTNGGAFENQSIEINRPVFSGNRGWGYGGVVRSIYHEFVHVVQKSILGLYSKNNKQLGFLREYWAYNAAINADHLPPARSSIMTSWRTSAEAKYNEMNSIYKLQTKVPFLFVKP